MEEEREKRERGWHPAMKYPFDALVQPVMKSLVFFMFGFWEKYGWKYLNYMIDDN